MLKPVLKIGYGSVCESVSSQIVTISGPCKHGDELFCTIIFLFFTMTNKCTIIPQIVTLLHISTLSFHPQGDCNQYLAKLH